MRIVGDTAEIACREAVVYSFVDLEKSNALIEKCLKLNPRHPRAHYLRGVTLIEQGDYEKAILAYETAITNYPESAHFYLNEVYNNLGCVFYRLGFIQQAKSAWEKAFLYLPSDKTSQQNLAMLK